jgi:truncated hemoglobin YjbI
VPELISPSAYRVPPSGVSDTAKGLKMFLRDDSFRAMSRFKVDEVNLVDQLGMEKFVELSTRFYTRVYEDPDPDFRAMFPDDMDMAIQNQYEFFIQRFGGPPLYSSRKGHPALRARHARFQITRQHAERWLGHMRAAMQDADLPEDARVRLDEFLTDTAYFMQNVGEDGSRLY